MKQYRLTFKIVTPVMIGEYRTTQNSQSLDYIPGTALLGGLAYAYLREKGLSPEQKDATFDRFFLADRVRIGNFYPANFTTSHSSNAKPPGYENGRLRILARRC